MANLTSIKNLSPDPITLPDSIGDTILNSLETISVSFDFKHVADALILVSLIDKVALKTIQFQGVDPPKDNIIGRALNISINAEDTIILDNIFVLGLTNFSLVINNDNESEDNITNITFWGSAPYNTLSSNQNDYFILDDGVLTTDLEPGKTVYYGFAYLITTLRITVKGTDDKVILANAVLHGNVV